MTVQDHIQNEEVIRKFRSNDDIPEAKLPKLKPQICDEFDSALDYREDFDEYTS